MNILVSIREGLKTVENSTRSWKKVFFLKLDHFLALFSKKYIFTIENSLPPKVEFSTFLNPSLLDPREVLTSILSVALKRKENLLFAMFIWQRPQIQESGQSSSRGVWNMGMMLIKWQLHGHVNRSVLKMAKVSFYYYATGRDNWSVEDRDWLVHNYNYLILCTNLYESLLTWNKFDYQFSLWLKGLNSEDNICHWFHYHYALWSKYTVHFG